MLLVTLFLSALVAAAAGEVSQHIVGGQDATHSEHPYICSLQMNYWGIWYHICGAVIYDPSHVVTAAHCVEGYGTFQVVCGIRRLSGYDASKVTRSVTRKTLHPDYDGRGDGFPNDIAVLDLDRPLQSSSHVSTNHAFAGPSSGNFAGQKCTLSGWGRTSGSSSQGADVLQKVEMTTLSHQECVSHWGSSSINDGHICFKESGKSACNGDSGGPVRCGDTIVGVTSWGINNCSPTYPSVYTRLSYFHSWIQSVVRQ
ncbi:chymotrypsin-like serine proteinase [Babylonia areolata]|uniref:chymotrypsin-like serine proteinase n=1 Tax=Babylonia areolata TaxID=304850 RepID=UPI003FD27BDB